MTVKHLQNLQRQQMAIAVATDPTVMTKFRSGFNECAAEVARYVNRIDGVDRAVRQRLVGHLRSCVNGLGQLSPATFACLMPGIGPGTPTAPYVPQVAPVHVPSATAALNVFSQMPSFGVEMTSVGAAAAPSRLSVVGGGSSNSNNNNNGGGGSSSSAVAALNLFPNRLTNGDLAFVIPSQPPSQVEPEMTTELAHGSRRPPSATTTVAPQSLSRLQPAFSTGAGSSPSVPCPSHPSSDRRTPSAFTSVVGSSNNSSAMTAFRGPPRGSSSPSCSSCLVSSTTSPRSGAGSVGFSPPHFHDNEDMTVFSLPSVKTEDEHRFLGMCSKLSGSRNSPDKEPNVPKIPKQEVVTTVNQTEAYDLSKPTTSSLCSVSEAEKMWRPW